jgi:hypothetical protein
MTADEVTELSQDYMTTDDSSTIDDSLIPVFIQNPPTAPAVRVEQLSK